ncbi:MAG: hypothetical protein K2N74_06215, partial [Clostridiales bacterium]|nr:hypothetical protein [Clostridiales bacterium]
TIISLCLLFALTIGAAIGLVAPVKRASAATSYAVSSIFAAGTGGEVGASEKKDDESFIEFSLQNKGKVHFRRDLALKWYEAEKSATSDDATEEKKEESNNPKGLEKYLSLQFAFPTLSFKTFTVTFESAEENISEDGKATNSVIFQNTNGTLAVAVKNAEQQADDFVIAEDAWKEVDGSADITLALSEENCSIGEFAVLCNGQEIGKFTNIGGYFMEYRSAASSTPNTPITFTAELAENEGAATATKQKVLMKRLNGQSFKLGDDGKVDDNTDPVLVLSEKVYAFSLGQRFSLNYEAIDVCDDTVTVSRSYYMYKDSDKAPSLTETSDDHYKLLTTSTFFMPPNDKGDEEEFVSIRFRLDDGANATYVNLAWYAADGAVAQKEYTETKEGEADVQKTYDYILVNRKTGGPVYTGITTKDAEGDNEAENVVSDEAKQAALDYQAAVTEAAKDANAGTGSYIYLPSLRGLISSEYTDYRNLRFSIYYYKENQTEDATASSQTSLRYNALKLEVDQMGWYKFRVLATDSADNGIMLYENDELVKVTSSNIWDFECIPEFTFHVDYSGAKIEDAGEQSQGSRNASYSFTSFDIRALPGYKTEYNLYHFESDKIPSGTSVPTYSTFVENAEEYAEKTYKEYLTEIRTFNDKVEEDSAEWDDTDNDYRWNPDSSLSFVPQKTGSYVLKVTGSDAAIPGFVTTGYQVVEVRNPVDTIPGQSQWLEDNVVSVVLFSISAVLAVVIVVLLLVKPSDKSLDEVDLKKLKGGKKVQKK